MILTMRWLDYFKLKDVRGARTLKETLSAQLSFEGITREALEALAVPFVKKTLRITQDVLRDAGAFCG